MVFGGQFERMEGLVYGEAFSEKENLCPWPDLDQRARYFGGIDWGYTNPFALVIHGIYPNRERYQLSETKKARLSLEQMIDLAKQKMKIFGVEHFFADPSEPRYIEAFNNAGIPTSPADNDVKYGCEIVWEEMKERRLKFVDGEPSKHTVDEIDTYHWPDPKDLKPDQDEKNPNPVAQNDHVLDAIRYVTVSTIDLHLRRDPYVPGQKPVSELDTHERAKQLKRTHRFGLGHNTEKWS